jgi:histone-lysine N-methyltransferase SETMAR
MVSVWWFAGGIIYHKFLDQGCSIDAKVYCSELEEMNIRLRDKQPRLINQRGPILLHDNARPHVAQLTLQKLNDLGFEILPHPPYSPDLSPTDYHLFKHLDHFLHQKQFATKSDIENGFEDFLKSRTPDFFWDGINNLISRWQKCLGAHGTYFN